MKLRLSLFSVFTAIRLAATVLLVNGFFWVRGFSMFSVLFFLARSFAFPESSVALLLVYLLLFLSSSVMIFIPKTRIVGSCLAIALYLMDGVSLLWSHLLGSNGYLFAGLPICLIGILLAAEIWRKNRCLPEFW